jgi:hypothetical protein
MYRVQVNRRASMSTLTFDGKSAASNEAAQRGKADTLRVAALAMLSIRFIQGFVYWGGGSRRFIYAPAKLDPNAANWKGQQIPIGDAWRIAWNRPYHRLSAASFLSALCFVDPVQRG